MANRVLGAEYKETHMAETGKTDSSLQNSTSSTHGETVTSESEKREQELATHLKKGSRDDLVTDAGLLKELGDVYFERGLKTRLTQHFVHASALFNAAWLRNKDPGFRKETEQSIRQTELGFCKVLGVKPEKLPIDYATAIQVKLNELRTNSRDNGDKLMDDIANVFNLDDPDVKRIAKESDFIDNVRILNGKVCDDVISFFQYLLSLSKDILGPSPQEYAVMGMGSLARGETTPYSDIEWSILVADDTKDVQYFRNLTRMTHFFVLNIRETILKSMGIKSLNDYDTPGGNWFVDVVSPRGFSYDSAAPYACDYPLGRPDRPGKKGRELIRTPYNMAKLCEYETVLKEGYHVDRVMATTVFMDGSERGKLLFEKFKAIRAQFKSRKEVQKKAFTDIRELIEEFYPKLSFHKDDRTVHNIKQELFRLPTLVISLFKTLFTLGNDNTLDILDEMKSKSLTNEKAMHNLKCLVSIVTFLRTTVYSSKSHQDELMSFLSFSPQSADGNSSANVAYLGDLKPLISRYYYTMIPFVEYLYSLDSDTDLNSIRFAQNFFQKDHLISGQIEMRLLSFDKARKHFFLHIESLYDHCNLKNRRTFQEMFVDGKEVHYDENDFRTKECLDNIALTYVTEGRYGPAAAILMQTLRMARKIHGCSDHIDVAGNLFCLGNVQLLEGNFDLAFSFLTDAKQMVERLCFINSSLMATILNTMGFLYCEIGKLDLALQDLKESYSIMKRLYTNGYHRCIAEYFNNIGYVYCKADKPDLALHNYQIALETSRVLHGSGDHPDIAIKLNNIAEVYCLMCMPDLALRYHKESLDMRKRIYHNHDSPYVATSMSNIGRVYRQNGNYELALQYQLNSLEIRKRVHHNDHPDIAQSLNNVGQVYLSTGNLELSLQYHRDSLNMLNRIFEESDHPDIATCLTNIGDVYAEKQNLTHAVSYQMDALNMLMRLHKHKENINIVYVLSRVINLKMKLGRTNEANRLSRYMSGILDKLFAGDPCKENRAENAQLLRATGWMALKCLTDMSCKFSGNQQYPVILIAFFTFADMYSKLGQFDLALQYYKKLEEKCADTGFWGVESNFKFLIFIKKWENLINLCKSKNTR